MQGLSDIMTGGYSRTRELARESSGEGIEAVARQFEAYFLGQMLKSMRDASMGDPLFGSNSQQMYQDMFDDQMTLALAGGRGIGLAKVLRGQLATLPGVDAAPNDEKPSELGTGNPFAFPAASRGVVAEPAVKSASAQSPEQMEQHNLSQRARKEIDAILPPTQAVTTSVEHLPFAEGNRALNIPAVPVVTAQAVAMRGASSAEVVHHRASTMKGRAEALNQRPSHFASPEEFVSALMPHAQRAAATLGVPAQVLIAQSALETGWGKHVMPGPDSRSSSNNLFGIKADGRWGGDKVVKRTMEFDGAVMKPVNAPFRAYANIGESFEDYVKFIQGNARYQPALEASGDAKRYINALQNAGYATDPNYAKKIISLMERGPIGAMHTTGSSPGPIRASSSRAGASI